MRTKILIVDDMEINREILCQIFEKEYETLQAEDGEYAIELLERYADEIAVVLLDVIMPKKDGFEVLKVMNDRGWIDKIPALFITGDTSMAVEVQGFEHGISDFIRKPFEAPVIKKRVKNIVELFASRNELQKKVESQTHILREQYTRLEEQAQKLESSNMQMIDILGTVVEHRNLESGQHIKRVKGFAKLLAQKVMETYPEYGLDAHQVEVISQASALHDIGKIAIPDNILLKPGRFTEEEFERMKTHTTEGCEILNQIEGIWDEEYRKVSYEICRYHHERYDGRGYPDGLKGEEIPISAQIVSVADVYDALVSERVYKNAISKEDAFHMILDGKCGAFSPKLMQCFRELKADFEALADELNQ